MSTHDPLLEENARLQAANDQLKQKADATALTNGKLLGDLQEAQRELAETRKALDEARAHQAQPDRDRRDKFILALLAIGWSSDDVVRRADALLLEADKKEVA